MDMGFLDDGVWQCCSCSLDAQSASWYATPPGEVGNWFTTVLNAEWRGLIDWIWNSEQPLVFDHVILNNTLGICKAREIRASIDQQLDLWDRGLHGGLVGDNLAEGRSR